VLVTCIVPHKVVIVPHLVCLMVVTLVGNEEGASEAVSTYFCYTVAAQRPFDWKQKSYKSSFWYCCWVRWGV